MVLSPRQTRLFFLTYTLLPFLAGLGHWRQGAYGWAGAYFFVSFPYLIALLLLQHLSPRSVVLLQTLGALMMLVISADLHRQGYSVIAALFVLAALLSVYVLWSGNGRK